MAVEIVRKLVGGVWRTVRSDEPGGGGSQPVGVLQSAEFLLVQDATPSPSYVITDVDTGAGTFTIAGDHTDRLFPGADDFQVTGSTGNDGYYTVASSEAVGDTTVVTANETINDGTIDGDLVAPALYEADCPMLEGAVVEDVRVYMLAEWSTIARMTVDDSLGSYIDAAFVNNLGAYDPTAPRVFDVNEGGGNCLAYNPGNPDASHAPDFVPAYGGSYVQANSFGLLNKTAPSDFATGVMPGPGVRYPADDTIKIRLTQLTPNDPATGQALVKILYYAAQTPTAATAS